MKTKHLHYTLNLTQIALTIPSEHILKLILQISMTAIEVQVSIFLELLKCCIASILVPLFIFHQKQWSLQTRIMSGYFSDWNSPVVSFYRISPALYQFSVISYHWVFILHHFTEQPSLWTGQVCLGCSLFLLARNSVLGMCGSLCHWFLIYHLLTLPP